MEHRLGVWQTDRWSQMRHHPTCETWPVQGSEGGRIIQTRNSLEWLAEDTIDGKGA